MRWRVRSSHPAPAQRHFSPKSVKAEEIVPPTPAEVKRIIAAAVTVNTDLAVCFRLAAATGMRRSELVALQWRDLSDAQIIIRRNRVRDGKQFVTFDTKSGTRSHRTINVDASTLQALEEVRARQAADGRECLWIFTHDGDESWKPEYLTHSYAGLQRDRSSVHGLRHFHATQLLSKGVPVTQVSHRLGAFVSNRHDEHLRALDTGQRSDLRRADRVCARRVSRPFSNVMI